MASIARTPKPDWLKVRLPTGDNYQRLKATMREKGLHTVCEEARCPNVAECWGQGTATFMILGDVCTRACKYCGVAHGMPTQLDLDEPRRVAQTVAAVDLGSKIGPNPLHIGGEVTAEPFESISDAPVDRQPSVQV